MKEQTPITAEDFLETSIPPQEIITASDDFCYTHIEVSWHMEQYAELRIQQEYEKWKEEKEELEANNQALISTIELLLNALNNK